MQKTTIYKTDDGIRLDKYLFRIMSAPSGEVYKSLRKKKIKINGKRTTDGTKRLHTGDVLELYINDEFLNISTPDESKPSSHTLNMPDIIYEDENIIIMNKPSGLLSQGEASLETIMREYLKHKDKSRGFSAYKPSLCHRLDRNTSGLIIGAKNITAHRIITEKIKSKEIRKFYICRISGTLKHDAGKITGYITKTDKNKVVFSDKNTAGGKYSELKYRLLSHNDSSSLLEIELLSGRTHQIRASFAHIGHPLIGDVKYGATKDGGHEFQSLKAYKLIFEFSAPANELEYLNNKIIDISDRRII